MTTVRKINVSQVEGDNANNTNTDEIRPYGELAVYIGDNDRLELLMADGVRTNLRNKVLNKGTFYGGDSDSGDGAGLDTIKLIPDAALHYNDGNYNNNQHIIIDPTAPNHIHIRAGGTIDNSSADLFLGGERNNVKVSDGYDNVQITTDAGEGTFTWTFDNNGDLTVPGNITKTSGNLEITAENYVVIDSTNGGQIDIGANQSEEGSGDSGPILLGHAGNILDIAAGKVRINSTTPPTTSTGAVGDVAGLVAFSSGYLYYCTADYGQVGHQVTVATLYNGATSINANNLQLTKTADTLQITVGDIISDSDGGATSTVVTVSSDENYTYVGTGGLAYNAVFPLTFTSTAPAYVSGGNIWKRVAWSADTW
jgi:hypothetical protein